MSATSSTASPSAKASSAAVRRLRRDLELLQKTPNPQILVRPAEDDLLEWHFVLHSLPSDSPYHEGQYHGKILFPAEYPHAPPSIVMVTPSGRLEVGQKLCLSMTDFHPESWNPAWSVETILVGLLSFFISDAEHGYGAISDSDERRRKLAASSRGFNARTSKFCSLFPDLLCSQSGQSSSSPQFAGGKQDADEGSAVAELRVLSPPEEQSQPADSAVLAPPNSPAVVTDTSATDEESAQECWICRDPDLTEPLIQPCACRGSMSGVHGSCVEQWVRHHRQNAVNGEAPCCSVCHQPYRGSEVRPGVWGFLRYFGYFGMILFIRSLVLVGLLVGYTSAADPKMKMPQIIRILLVVAFSLAAIYKVILLTVSLPPHRPPPRNQYLRHVFVSNFHRLLIHLFETYYATMILTLVAITRWPHRIPIEFYMPFAIGSLVPLGKVFQSWLVASQLSASEVWRRLCEYTCYCMACPYVVGQALLLACHPLDAGLHCIVGIAILPMAWCLQSNESLVVLWSLHCALLIAALLERVYVKRFTWKQGRSWLVSMQTTLLGAYVANALCEFPKGVGAPHYTAEVDVGISLLWLGLVCGLGLHINWHYVARYYGTWQNRHGTFRLSASDGGSRAVAPLQVPNV